MYHYFSLELETRRKKKKESFGVASQCMNTIPYENI